MGTICRKHLFVPTTVAGGDVDVDAMLQHIHRILVEGFDRTADNVVVMIDQANRSVSVRIKDTWTCRIDLMGNVAQLLLDLENWRQGDGMVLDDNDHNAIAAAFPRLDIVCDLDGENDFNNEFSAICLYLQLNFMVRYSYDPTQRTFHIHDV
jgi:hypothetical protein